MKYTPIAIAVVVLIAILGLFTSMYVVTEKDQAFITRFGKIQGTPTTKPGLFFRVPFIDKLWRFEKRILEWDGHPSEVTTKDKRFIAIDSYARWRISDPKIFFENVKDEVFAQSRLDDILDGTTRTAVSKHDLVEVVRSDKERKAVSDGNQTEGQGELQPFTIGRQAISDAILKESREKVKEYGIELLDFQFKRINYAQTVQAKIFERMIAERKQLAEKFRSEGQGRAAEIEGTKLRKLDTIESSATREEKEIQGRADAEAAGIYAEAYSQSPQSEEFYNFMKTMETYKMTLTQKDTLILSTKSEFFRFLREMQPATKADPK
jgi:membrane protease subunit HflC